MLTFRETPKQSNSSDVLTSVTAGKKQRKKRSKKKKNANLRVSDGASDSSDSDEEDNFQIEVADMKPAEFHLLGAVISDPNDNSTMQLAQSIAFRMSIGKEEVIKCIEWMWDRGLKYDDEESVEKCIREQVSC